MKFAVVPFTLLLACAVPGRAAARPLQTVPRVDLARYLGTWYEIATIPQRFQKGCTGVTATYTQRPDGDITVVNACRKDSLAGKFKSVTGKAWVVDKQTNAKLKVRFFWPFSGDYWVIDLDSTDYRYAVVGHPDRKYLWILSRTPQMPDSLYTGLVQRIVDVHGYDIAKLKRTPQPAQ